MIVAGIDGGSVVPQALGWRATVEVRGSSVVAHADIGRLSLAQLATGADLGTRTFERVGVHNITLEVVELQQMLKSIYLDYPPQIQAWPERHMKVDDQALVAACRCEFGY